DQLADGTRRGADRLLTLSELAQRSGDANRGHGRVSLPTETSNVARRTQAERGKNRRLTASLTAVDFRSRTYVLRSLAMLSGSGQRAGQSLAQLTALHNKGTRRLRCLGGEGAFAALTIARLAETLPAAARPLIAVVPDEVEARALRRDIQMFAGG